MRDVLDVGYYKSCAETLDQLPERVVRYRRADLTVLYCNAAWAEGHDVTPSDVVGHSLDEFLTPAERDGLRAQLARLGPDNAYISDDVARAAPNAPGEWVEWVDQYLSGPDGPEVLAVGRDVSGRHMAELNLAASEARFRELADKSADVVWRFVLEPDPHFDYMSPSVEKTLGYPAEYFLDDFSRYVELLSDDDRALIERAFAGEQLPERVDFHHRHADGSIVIGETQITLLRNGLQGVSRDVTELRRLQGDLAELALRDPLTGLANRRLFSELLAADLERARREQRVLAVAYLDLDDFKDVNDTHGHDAGDIVLAETAHRLRSSVRKADGVARLGGDEFAIVYQPSEQASDDLIARISTVLSEPIAISATTKVSCPASIGRADTRAVGYDAAALLAAADAAMYEVKRARRPRSHPGPAAA